MRAELLCPKCHQPLRFARAGVHLSAIKVLIFDILQAAGPDGLPLEEIGVALAAKGRASTNVNSIRSHLWQMRDALAGSGFRIAAERRRPFRWSLIEPSEAVA